MATKLVLGDVYQALATKTKYFDLFAKAATHNDGFVDLKLEINLYTNSRKWMVETRGNKFYFDDLQLALDMYNQE